MKQNFKTLLQVLRAKSQEKWSGCIEIEESQDTSINWQVYFREGQIQYIGNNNGKLERLSYLCHKFNLVCDCDRFTQQDTSEYQYLDRYLSHKQLSNLELEKILFDFIQEGLTHILSIKKANVRLISGTNGIKSSIAFNLERLQVKAELNSGQRIKQYFNSPFSRLYVEKKNLLKFYRLCKPIYASPKLSSLKKSHSISSFVNLFVAKYSLYEIAQKTNVDIYTLAKYLELAVTENIIALLPFSEVAVNKTKTTKNSPTRCSQSQQKSQIAIVCIDDSKTVQKQVRMISESVGYQIVGILDPTLALTALTRKQPDLIFMDVNMPNINGYELCEILRKFHKLKEVPIVMLTAKNGISDRLKAKSAGANDYLTKPFQAHELIQCVELLTGCK